MNPREPLCSCAERPAGKHHEEGDHLGQSTAVLAEDDSDPKEHQPDVLLLHLSCPSLPLSLSLFAFLCFLSVRVRAYPFCVRTNVHSPNFSERSSFPASIPTSDQPILIQFLLLPTQLNSIRPFFTRLDLDSIRCCWFELQVGDLESVGSDLISPLHWPAANRSLLRG